MYIVKAEANQVEKIVDMSVRAFETDVYVGGVKGDCPPEFDSVEWHKQMAREGHLYQAMIGKDLVGAAIVFPDETEKSVYIGRIFIDSVYHRKGYGIRLMDCIEKYFPWAAAFHLDTPLRRISDMNEYIAYCGLNCEACEARLATVNNDDALRQRVAREWSELNGVEITAEMINCLGCRIDGVKTPYCESLCPIRQCAMGKGLETCGGCGEMERCEKLGAITGNNADALKRLKTGI